MSKITRDSVRSALQAIGCTMRRVEGQWRVNIKGMGEGQAYYSDSLRDALDTGHAMVAEHSRMELARWDARTAQRLAFELAQHAQDARA